MPVQQRSLAHRMGSAILAALRTEKQQGPVSFGSAVPAVANSFLGFVREPQAGAWQRNLAPADQANILAFSAVYQCVTLIANDIGKLRIMAQEQAKTGIWQEVLDRDTPADDVLQKPNSFQTRIQFFQYWLATKLLHGNSYVLKERDASRKVIALYVLNPFFVTPMVTADGSVWYQIAQDWLANQMRSSMLPASEIIHDRCCCIWHPLVGVSPIYACATSATQGIKIQTSSAKFFDNMSRPSGQLTSPNTIDDVTANRLKKEFEEGYSGQNVGRLLVTGDGLKFEAMTVPPVDAQLIQQQKWTVEDVGRAFDMPLYKLGGPLPALNSVAALNQEYYSQTLQIHMESIELLLREGLELDSKLRIKFDLEGLLRMDPLGRAEFYKAMGTSGAMGPNEMRHREDMPPVEGGDTPYLQQQNYSLSALAKRDAAAPAPATPGAPAPAAAPAPAPAPAAAEPPSPSAKEQEDEIDFALELLTLYKNAEVTVGDEM